MTDGVQSLEAMEYQSIPALSTALRFGILIAVFFFFLLQFSECSNKCSFIYSFDEKGNSSNIDVDEQD